MLNLRYDTQAARDCARHISEVMRDAAYEASTELARERGPFPLFKRRPLSEPRQFRLASPAALKDQIRASGLRNSHLLSIAPTGTISLAFADNASNGIEPAFSWTYTRKKRMNRTAHRASTASRTMPGVFTGICAARRTADRGLSSLRSNLARWTISPWLPRWRRSSIRPSPRR